MDDKFERVRSLTLAARLPSETTTWLDSTNASQAASVLLDFKAATACTSKHDLLARAKDHGDARLLPSLKQIKQARGRGFFSRDPYPCMRKDTALEDAITAVEARVPAK